MRLPSRLIFLRNIFMLNLNGSPTVRHLPNTSTNGDQPMRRISLAVLILPLLAVDPTHVLAMGGGGGAGGGGAGAGAGGSSAGAGGSGAGAGGAGNGAPVNVNRHVVPPAASAQAYEPSPSDAVKEPLVVQSRDPRSLERPGRQ